REEGQLLLGICSWQRKQGGVREGEAGSAQAVERGCRRAITRRDGDHTMFMTQKHLSRRTVLKGIGVTMGLPLLEAMAPVSKAFGATTGKKIRLVCVEMVHGAAGSAAYGIKKNLWAPAGGGRDFDLTGTSPKALE